uniref:H/ACA ribonucleoprotein complex non-core subunit NAF1 isoform X2 n=1 Tax=Doryrhamphus excisus TaxID=161450 RepID=UPI0025AE2F31|nr:H/ACA ribonucleoprotein complex non-core subunit NAF1 isoform X2 [Doryrhamphus excisus]
MNCKMWMEQLLEETKPPEMSETDVTTQKDDLDTESNTPEHPEASGCEVAGSAVPSLVSESRMEDADGNASEDTDRESSSSSSMSLAPVLEDDNDDERVSQPVFKTKDEVLLEMEETKPPEMSETDVTTQKDDLDTESNTPEHPEASGCEVAGSAVPSLVSESRMEDADGNASEDTDRESSSSSSMSLAPVLEDDDDDEHVSQPVLKTKDEVLLEMEQLLEETKPPEMSETDVTTQKDDLDTESNTPEHPEASGCEVAGSAVPSLVSESRMEDADGNASEDTDSDSSSSSSSSLSPAPVFENDDDDERISQPVFKTKDEVLLEDLPAVEELKVSLPEGVTLNPIGTVSSIIEQLVIIQSLRDTPPLTDDSIIFRDDRLALGKVFEIFGPVSSPLYVLRFNSPEDLSNKGLTLGLTVYYAPDMEEYTGYILIQQLQLLKGSDASWKNDQEPPEEALDYSDDEKEQQAKRMKNSKKKQNKYTENCAQGTTNHKPHRHGVTGRQTGTHFSHQPLSQNVQPPFPHSHPPPQHAHFPPPPYLYPPHPPPPLAFLPYSTPSFYNPSYPPAAWQPNFGPFSPLPPPTPPPE